MKTLRLIEQYMNLLEQDVEQDVEQETDVNVDVEVEEEPQNPALQSMAELIAAAFAYPPTDRDADAIDEIELMLVGTHNEAPPTPELNPRSVIKNIVARLPVQLRTVYTRGPGVAGFSAEDEIYLSQILADAFRYRPKTTDSHIISTVNKQYNAQNDPEANPMKVIETVQSLLSYSDESVEDELQDIKIDTE